MKQYELLGKARDIFYFVLVYLTVWHSDLDHITYFHLYLKSDHLYIIQKNHPLLEHLIIFSSGDLIRFLEVGIQEHRVASKQMNRSIGLSFSFAMSMNNRGDEHYTKKAKKE